MIILDMSDKRPLYEQIVERIQEMITRGVIKPGEKLPSVRQLAIELSINPNTIQRAYGELERNGFIYSVKGRGNFASDVGGLLPARQEAYFKQLDVFLVGATDLKIEKERIMDHVEQFYKTHGTKEELL